MSEKNVELVRRGLRDFKGVVELLDEQVVWDNTAYAPLDIDGIYRGKESVVRMIKKWVGTWTEYRYEVEELIDAGDSVVLVISESGRGIGSGLPMTQHYCQVWTFRGGRLVRGATFKTKSEGLEAAGLSE